MEDTLTRGSPGPSPLDERTPARGRRARRGDPEATPNHLSNRPADVAAPRRSPLEAIKAYLPRGNTLDDESFRKRHLLLCWILGLHLPGLFLFGVWRGYGVAHSALEITVPGACLIFGRLAKNRRVASFYVTVGLVACSTILVHLSGGTIEAHFHYFILVGLIGLYQDWLPFLWNIGFTVLTHGVGSSIAPDLMYNHEAAQRSPWTWAVIHGISVLAACLSVIILWRNNEIEQQRAIDLADDLAQSQLSTAQREAAQRRSIAELFVNLARRNQSLLNRQLGLIAELEQREREPESLAELFQLDHLATRIRRNAESLIVLSGAESPRRWGQPVPLGEVVRAAAAEIEDYERVEVLVSDHLEVAGRAVADLSHLLAELIENAALFSPPHTEVRVRSHLAEWSTFVLSIEDTGIGMSADDLRAANQLLSEPPDVDITGATLGFHVVGRLARRYDIRVQLAGTPGGGTTALVTLPDDLVSERRRALEPASAGGGWSPPTAAPPARAAHIAPEARPTGLDWPHDLAPAPVPAQASPPRLNGWHVGPPSSPPDQGGPRPEGPHGGPPGPPAQPGTFGPPGQPGRTGGNGHAPVTGPAEPPAARPPRPRPPTIEGLARRVPGAGLASLQPSQAETPTTPVSEQDRQHVNSMLSRFQKSQRAGRAAADPPPDRPTEESP